MILVLCIEYATRESSNGALVASTVICVLGNVRALEGRGRLVKDADG